MFRFKQHIFSLLLLAAILLFKPADVQAFIPLAGNGALGSYTGSFEYTVVDATHGTVTVVLENTSPALNGGYLTAFAFNNPSNSITAATFASTEGNFGIIGFPYNSNLINAQPDGQFDIGASTASDYQGGGMPQLGIAVGATETFTFNLTGLNMDTLTEQIFFNTLSAPPVSGGGPEEFVARFRGFEDGGSDKVPHDAPPPNVVPEPATMILFSSGLAAAALRRRKRA